MEHEERAKTLAVLSGITREIKKLEDDLVAKRGRESALYKALGMRNPTVKRNRMTQEKATLIRTSILSCMQEIHDKGLSWLALQLIVNRTKRELSEDITTQEIEGQIRGMAKDEVLVHNGNRGPSSSYCVAVKEVEIVPNVVEVKEQ